MKGEAAMQTATRRAGFPWPVLVLYVLSPVVGELLSSASPPVEFFSVFGLTVMCVLYGSGALPVRELVRAGCRLQAVRRAIG
jgi:hypothetical protein